MEHLVLSIARDDRVGGAMLAELGITAAKLEAAVAKLRRGTNVTDQGAEGKYESLDRYARDLTAEARAGNSTPSSAETTRFEAPSRSSPAAARITPC